MIGKICGTFAGYYNNVAIIEVDYNDSSVGYEVIMKTSDILSLNVGEKTTLFIKEIIKEDDDVLYGFIDFEEKCFFEELIKLSGLGPKIALAILSTYSCENIIDAINTNNCVFFSSISGIGSKLANRIPNEMYKNIEKIQEKVINFGQTKTDNIKEVKQETQATLLNVDENNEKKIIKQKNTSIIKNKCNIKNENKTIVDDAVNALIVLGFSKQQVYNDVFKIVKDSKSHLTTEDIVKKFLQENKK